MITLEREPRKQLIMPYLASKSLICGDFVEIIIYYYFFQRNVSVLTQYGYIKLAEKQWNLQLLKPLQASY